MAGYNHILKLKGPILYLKEIQILEKLTATKPIPLNLILKTLSLGNLTSDMIIQENRITTKKHKNVSTRHMYMTLLLLVALDNRRQMKSPCINHELY